NIYCWRQIMNERYLIVNADDFGLTRSMNGAIAELFRQGTVTSSTILAPARFAVEACRSAAEIGIPVGTHWTLHAEWADEPWRASAGDEAPSLAKNGYLYADARETAQSARAKDVTRELEAQYRFLLENGCIADHADSHGGTLYGTNGRFFFLNAFRVCKAHALPFRFAKSAAFIARQTGSPLPPALETAHRAIVSTAQAYRVPLPDEIVTHPLPVERIGGYEALCAYYERELSTCGPGITEVFLHPSLPDEALEKKTPQWRKRVWEYEYLKSGRLNRFAEKEGFRLVSWKDAPFQAGR
ncbi:MAG TPA: ChbG/HpnK family deacetylase, partial [Clostridia bacterium]|nr:ChbG/HpnK family deacetylase [Clostridia bacterium]